MKTEFLGDAYEARSLNIAANRCINLLPMIDKGGLIAGFLTAPGLLTYANLGAIASGIYTASNGRCFTVAGTVLYEIFPSGILTNRGIVTYSNVSRMSDNGAELIIVNGTDGWLFTFATNVLAQIVDADFPNGCKTIDFLDGYFVTYKPNTQEFYISNLYDGATWDTLDFSSAEGNPDNAVGSIVARRELWIFGDQSAEVFYNSGDATFPLARNSAGVIDVGCAATYSIAEMDGSVFWLGKTDKGQGVVYRATGYTPQRISNYALEYAIQNYSVISDAIAFCVDIEGFLLYFLTFPTANKSWCYNAKTGLWNEMASFLDGEYIRWEAQEYAFFDGKHLVCDYSEGKIYELTFDSYKDGTATRKWLRAWPAPESENAMNRYDRLVIRGEMGVGLTTGQGSDPKIMFRCSKDGGHTWSSERTASIGKVGQYGIRCVFNRLGITQNYQRMIFEISGTDPVKIALTGASLE